VLAVLMLGDDRTFIDLEIEESYIKLLEQEFLAYYVREPVKQPSKFIVRSFDFWAYFSSNMMDLVISVEK
jgi:hypothetical protein